MELRALTNDSSKSACCEILPAVQLNLGLGERLLEGRHRDCCRSIPLVRRLRGSLGALIANAPRQQWIGCGERQIPKPGDSIEQE